MKSANYFKFVLILLLGLYGCPSSTSKMITVTKQDVLDLIGPRYLSDLNAKYNYNPYEGAEKSMGHIFIWFDPVYSKSYPKTIEILVIKKGTNQAHVRTALSMVQNKQLVGGYWLAAVYPGEYEIGLIVHNYIDFMMKGIYKEKTYHTYFTTTERNQINAFKFIIYGPDKDNTISSENTIFTGKTIHYIFQNKLSGNVMAWDNLIAIQNMQE